MPLTSDPIQWYGESYYLDGAYYGGADSASGIHGLYSWVNENLGSAFPYKKTVLQSLANASPTPRNNAPADYWPTQVTTDDVLYQNQRGGPFWKNEGPSNMNGYLPDSEARAARSRGGPSDISVDTSKPFSSFLNILRGGGSGVNASSPLVKGIVIVIGIMLLAIAAVSLIIPSGEDISTGLGNALKVKQLVGK